MAGSAISEADRKRRKREGILIGIIIVVVSLLTYAENQILHFGSAFPISNTILMFILININLLLLILLLFLVFRNLVKLLYDRKRKVMGTRLRTRLVVTFVALTLLPSTVLFFFSINFITNSIEFWFNVPVEQALENSLEVGRRLYTFVEEGNRFYIDRVAYQIKMKKLMEEEKRNALSRYIQVVQRAFHIDAIEVYSSNFDRITFAVSPQFENEPFRVITADNLLKESSNGGVRTVSEVSGQGELIRTIGTIPFGVKPKEAKGFVVLSLLVASDLAERLDSISRGYEEYQQIKLLKDPIQVTYYITLSIVALLVVFCAIWFGFHLAKTISIPIMDLAEGTRRVAEGDLRFTIAAVADDEIGSLVDSFNQMTRDLRSSRQQLEQSAQKLKEQNVEIEERRQYMEILLKNVSAGVISIDADGTVTTFNTSAERMLHLKAADVINESVKKILKGKYLNLADEVRSRLSRSSVEFVELPLRLSIAGEPRSFLANFSALTDDSNRHMGIVMVFDDLTELEKAQRMAAWREVARRIAHEVKNPLTPITLSAQRLKRKYSPRLDDPIFDECTNTIIDHVDLIRNLVNEFSSFARFPAANPQPCDLASIIEETVALYREGHRDVKLKFETFGEIPKLNLDRQQIKQALINIVDNAITAMRGRGSIQFQLSHDPILKIARLEISDDGVGISDEVKTRLFEPNFSTKKTGMGLGLTIVSTIVQDHRGRIRVQDNLPEGAKFIIELPA